MKRRTVLSGLIGTLAAGAPMARTMAQGQQPSADLVGCVAEPGIALFIDLVQGRPVMTPEELLPRANWQPFASPATTVSFFFPPDWAGQVLFASTFTPKGAPQWTAQQQGVGGIVSARVIEPRSTALWEYAVASLQGAALTIDQAIAIAEGGELGEGAKVTRFCARTDPTINGGTAWLTAVESNGAVLLTNGTLYADASGFAPYSVLTYFGMGGPRARLEQLMRQVFLRIQFQLLQGGGDPTPTPTP